MISQGQDKERQPKQAVPKATELAKLKSRDEKNFVKKNLLKVVLEPTQAAAKAHVEEKQEPFSHKN